MIKRNHLNYFMIVITSVLILFWGVYTYFFQLTYSDAKDFATEGAQPIVQILEILNFRATELLPYFIVFFSLTSLSLLYLLYLFLFITKYNLNVFPLICLSILFFIVIGINFINKLSIVFLLLSGVSILLMVSITLTVKYLYVDKVTYEEGEIIRVKGPFETEAKANQYAEIELEKFKEEFKNIDLYAKASVWLEDTGKYFVDIYIEKIGSELD